jgi:hypothetical protein
MSQIIPRAKRIQSATCKKKNAIEHIICCRLKKYRIIAKDVLRNKLRKHNKALVIVSGLINHRIMNYHN